ncbi:MAG: hypothetical protein WCO67_15360, partial [Betaproteobacteria bacterium]
MYRVLAETALKIRVTEHDLRVKVGSDAESLEKARALRQYTIPTPWFVVGPWKYWKPGSEQSDPRTLDALPVQRLDRLR